MKVQNRILDYEQVLNKLQIIEKKGIIKRAQDIGMTEHMLPIQHYVVGNGKKHIVITGATHGCEIITTDFILHLMNNITNETNTWKPLLDDFTIDFIPILNPEGYLISTSAIRKLIPTNMPSDVAEKICKEYYKYYKYDDITDSIAKKHQEMFADIDYTCIPEKYPEIRSSIKRIFELYPDLPNGCLQTWSANGNGIDIQANSLYNPAIARINNGEQIFMNSRRNNNVNISHPGPINCPFDRSKGSFKLENETLAITNFLEKLNNKKELFGYINYHSTGGMIFQRPAIIPDGLNISKNELLSKELLNYLCSRLYSEKTFKDAQSKANYTIYPSGLPNIKSKADICNNSHINVQRQNSQSTCLPEFKNSQATSLNDILRLKYPLDLLIELSAMGGNPIGPYGDINGNYRNVMFSNLCAIKELLEYGLVAEMISNECVNVFTKLGYMKQNCNEGSYRLSTHLLDFIYLEFIEKAKLMKHNTNYNIVTNDDKSAEL